VFDISESLIDAHCRRLEGGQSGVSPLVVLGRSRSSSPPSIGGTSIVPLIEVVVVLIIVGVLLWLVNSYIPMAPAIKSLLNAVVVIALIIWILKLVGLWHYITQVRL
jgi:hypothetical protein